MARAKPVQVGLRLFPRQLDALSHFKAILEKYDVGAVVDSPTDIEDLDALLLRHKDLDEKVGRGVLHFVAMFSSEGTKCFGVKRIDGSVVDFSFHRCINQRW
jgi:hypothetical protein